MFLAHFLIFISPMMALAAINVEIKNPKWDDASWVSHQDDFSICNNSPISYVLDGVRYQTPEVSAWTVSEPVQGKDKTYDFKIPEYKKRVGGNQCLTFDTGFTGTPTGNDWTPYDPQALVKTGYCGGLSQEPNSSPITCAEAISSTQSGDYYNDNYCLIDGFGTRGGPMSGGWIDTFEGETQIQVALPQIPFNQNSTFITFEPDEMGGPMYMMALAMGQEYMHMDMQFLIGIGGGENFTGMVHWETMGEVAGPRAGLLYGTGNNGMNGVDFGPFSIEPPTMGDNVTKSYPSFFPEYPCLSEESAPGCPSGHDIANEYMQTPGTGMVAPNSPEMAGAVIISGLGFWFIYDLIANATDFCMAQVISEGKDSLAAMKMMGKAYNKGINSGYENPFSDPSAIGMEDITPLLGAGGGFYVEKALKGAYPLVEANHNSKACGGTEPIYDAKIDKKTLQDFFFGTDGTPTTLGHGGVMHHFSATPEKREEMWDDVMCAFNSLSSHWSNETPSISYRYDFISILRVAKRHFSVARPLPNNFTYTNWLLTRTENPVACDGTVIDEDYPWWEIQSKVQSSDFIIEIKVEDNDSIAKVEWSLGDEWISWEQATWKNGTGKGDASYNIQIPQSLLQEMGLEKSHFLWIRTTDGCGNSTIGKTLIEGQPLPSLDSAFVYDVNGDGEADSIHVYGSEFEGPDASEAIKLFEFDSLSYAWPNISTHYLRSPADFKNGEFSIFDNELRGSSGQGQATLYIQGGPLNTPIEDRIGPVISYAAITDYPVASKADTLIILFSEAIQLDFKTDFSYLLVNGVEVSSSQVKHINGQLYHFIFPQGTIVKDDLVKIRFESEITDVNQNPALAINQEVIVILDEGPIGLADSGHGFFDMNNDGTMDRLVINFLRPAQGKPMDVELNWKDDDDDIQLHTLLISDAQFTNTLAIWNFDSTLNFATETTYYDSTQSNWGQVTVTQDNLSNGEQTIQVFNPKDQMPPIAIESFLQLGSTLTSGDQLRVKFSEPMNTEINYSLNLFNIYTQNQPSRSPQNSDMSSNRWTSKNHSIIVKYKGEPLERPQIGDSLNLVSEQIEILEDLAKNQPSVFNPLVQIRGKQTLQFFGPDLVHYAKFDQLNQKPPKVIAFDPHALESDASLLHDNLPGIGFDFAYQDQAGVSREEMKLDYEVFYYTNLGGYVTHKAGTLTCLDLEDLGVYGACDPTKVGPSKKIRLFIPWNYKDKTGKLVGSGAYIQKSTVTINHLEKIKSSSSKLIGIRR